ncbi:MAG: recombinase family protein [Candidatus Moraniibacteriota bacterium]|nr:MAG: recombinase family protein [Candidatus Moranbacteria bacterium]
MFFNIRNRCLIYVFVRQLNLGFVGSSLGDLRVLAKALAFCQAGDVLVVWKLDRLGRSLPHLLSIINTLKNKQVAFRSLTECMDTTTLPASQMAKAIERLGVFCNCQDVKN